MRRNEVTTSHPSAQQPQNRPVSSRAPSRRVFDLEKPHPGRNAVLHELCASRLDFDEALWRKHQRERQRLRARGR